MRRTAAEGLVLALFAGGCGASGINAQQDASPPQTDEWHACAFLSEAGFTETEDPGDTGWPSADEGAARQFAEARCDLRRPSDSTSSNDEGTPDLAPWNQLSVVARLSRLEDRTPAGQLQLLAEEGYPQLETTTSAGDGPQTVPEILAYNRTDDAGADAGSTLRAERHAFLSETCPGGGTYHLYLVVSVLGMGTEDAAATLTRQLMGGLAASARVRAAQIVERHYAACAPPDGGPTGDALDAASDAPPADAEAGSDAGEAGLPLDQLPDRLTAAYCGKLAACCAVAAVGPTLSDPATCAQQVDFQLELLAASAQTAVAAGALAYDPGPEASCVSAFESAACADVAATLNQIPCLDLLEPLAPPGATCTTSLACVDSYCLFDASAGVDGAAPTGVCAARKDDGEACTTGPECRSLYCSSSSQRCDQRPQSLCMSATP